jgi:hypothetical protein
MKDKPLGDVKVGELPQHIKEAITAGNARKWYTRWIDAYRDKYFRPPGSIKPLFHAIIALGLIGYISQYPHLRKEALRKYH